MHIILLELQYSARWLYHRFLFLYFCTYVAYLYWSPVDQNFLKGRQLLWTSGLVYKLDLCREAKEVATKTGSICYNYSKTTYLTWLGISFRCSESDLTFLYAVLYIIQTPCTCCEVHQLCITQIK